jgi:hypothetical protein
MRMTKHFFIAILAALLCSCTTRVDLGMPLIALYKYHKHGLQSGIQIYYNGRTLFMQRDDSTGQQRQERGRISGDTLRALLETAEALMILTRDPDHRYLPFQQSRYSLDLEEPQPVLPEYIIWMYQNEYRSNGVSVYPDSPRDLRDFGERVRKAAKLGRASLTK